MLFQEIKTKSFDRNETKSITWISFHRLEIIVFNSSQECQLLNLKRFKRCMGTLGKIFFWHYSIKIIGNFLICFVLLNWFFSLSILRKKILIFRDRFRRNVLLNDFWHFSAHPWYHTHLAKFCIWSDPWFPDVTVWDN